MSKNTKFLYGASVQGIQGFIFQTNELKDIVGASLLVEDICTNCFKDYASDGQVVVKAAGTIKYIFDDEKSCKKAVREFPRKVMTAAPGITISEAVVPFTDDDDFALVMEQLEAKLRAQRNKPFPSLTTGLMGIERSRRTGLPAVTMKNGEPIDEGTRKKQEARNPSLFEKFFGFKPSVMQIPLDVETMTDDNSWLAVIHADGNGLGEIVPKVGVSKELMAEFSEELGKATENAAQEAFKETMEEELKSKKGKIEDADKEREEKLPFRPVVLGGDDLTLICRADLAITFTTKFLAYFEKHTGVLMEQLKSHGADINLPKLTACAGIAFIKESYPFHYGYRLAEMLCDKAKRDAKRNEEVPAPSCLMFHKVQSSFVESFDEIERKELTPSEGHSFVFGPYYIHEQADRWTVEKLLAQVALLKGKEGNAMKSDIRQWMTLMSEDVEKAHQKKLRVMSLSSGRLKEMFDIVTSNEYRGAYPAYDMLALHSIHTLVTKKN